MPSSARGTGSPRACAAPAIRTGSTGWAVDKVELDLGDGPEAGSERPWRGEVETVSALASCQAVVHCGGLTRARKEAGFMAVNAGGTRRLARAASVAGVRRFIFVSSLAARGPDGAGGPVDPYGRSKATAEAALAEVSGPMETVVLRPGGVYGPRDTDLLPLFKLVARGWTVIPRSRVRLQPVFVADVVGAVLAALEAGPSPDPLPVASAETHSWGRSGKRPDGRSGAPRSHHARAPHCVF